MSQARSKVVFEVHTTDGAALGNELGVDRTDLQRLGKYEVIMQLMADGLSTKPATAITLEPPPPTGLGPAIRAASQAAYGRSPDDIEEEMARRQGRQVPGQVLPPVGVRPLK
jgi:hypothetical protein